MTTFSRDSRSRLGASWCAFKKSIQGTLSGVWGMLPIKKKKKIEVFTKGFQEVAANHKKCYACFKQAINVLAAGKNVMCERTKLQLMRKCDVGRDRFSLRHKELHSGKQRRWGAVTSEEIWKHWWRTTTTEPSCAPAERLTEEQGTVRSRDSKLGQGGTQCRTHTHSRLNRHPAWAAAQGHVCYQQSPRRG